MGEIEPTTEPHSVDVRQVSKMFGAVEALDTVSVTIRRGEFFSLLGPSGCGKTTLLRIIGGFEAPSAGDVLIDGESVIHQPPYLRKTNMIFQHLALFPHMTVEDNIAFGLRMKRQSEAEITKAVREALALIQLEELGKREIEQLSGGQKQRVAIARALVNHPSVLLLDEPLGALDLQLRLQMQEEMRSLHREVGNTFIFVTHDQGEAMAMSDRIAVMDSGRILQVGTPEEVYESPATRFVARFVGHTNLLEGRVSETSPDSACEVDCGGFTVRCHARQSVTRDQPVTLALRYEKTEIKERAAKGGVAATIVSRTYTGAVLRFRLRTDTAHELVADSPNTGRGLQYREGDAVSLHWADDSVALLVD